VKRFSLGGPGKGQTRVSSKGDADNLTKRAESLERKVGFLEGRMGTLEDKVGMLEEELGGKKKVGDEQGAKMVALLDEVGQMWKVAET
jgi:hypothetical protein